MAVLFLLPLVSDGTHWIQSVETDFVVQPASRLKTDSPVNERDRKGFWALC